MSLWARPRSFFCRDCELRILVENSETGERMASANPQGYFLTADGTCYHGRIVSGGRQGDAGPLALKRELRQHESEVRRLEAVSQEQQAEVARLEAAIAEAERHLASLTTEHVEAQKALVAASHQREQARTEFRRVDSRLATEREEIARLHAEAEAARDACRKARSPSR